MILADFEQHKVQVGVDTYYKARQVALDMGFANTVQTIQQHCPNAQTAYVEVLDADNRIRKIKMQVIPASDVLTLIANKASKFNVRPGATVANAQLIAMQCDQQIQKMEKTLEHRREHDLPEIEGQQALERAAFEAECQVDMEMLKQELEDKAKYSGAEAITRYKNRAEIIMCRARSVMEQAIKECQELGVKIRDNAKNNLLNSPKYARQLIKLETHQRHQRHKMDKRHKQEMESVTEQDKLTQEIEKMKERKRRILMQAGFTVGRNIYE